MFDLDNYLENAFLNICTEATNTKSKIFMETFGPRVEAVLGTTVGSNRF